MIGAPPTAHENLEKIDLIVRQVDERGRQADQRWGTGRLPLLVPIEWAERFRTQRQKFSAAVWEYDGAQVAKHGDAMLRAYAKLDELAAVAGHSDAPVDQWEFMAGDDLVVLVRTLADTARVDLQGRKAQVWSLDEIASVIQAHPMIVAAKSAFPGAEVESVRPAKAVRDKLNDDLQGLPF